METTYETMMAGIRAARPEATLGDLGFAMQSVAEAQGFSVVEDYCGHGIGRVYHSLPNVLNYGVKGQGMKLVPGLVFTVEPMVNIGRPDTMTLSDGWTVVTKDRQLSAHFEYSVAITENGPIVLTPWGD